MANRYADRILAEHPVASWGLDDNAGFQNLLYNNPFETTLWGGWTANGAYLFQTINDTWRTNIPSHFGGELPVIPPSFPIDGAPSKFVGLGAPSICSIRSAPVSYYWNKQVSDLPMTFSVYVYVPVAGMIDWIDVGSVDDGNPDYPPGHVEGAYTRTYLNEDEQPGWFRVESPSIQFPTESEFRYIDISIHFNASYSGGDYFYLHAPSLGYGAEYASNRSTGIAIEPTLHHRVDSGGLTAPYSCGAPYIKGWNVWSDQTDGYETILEEMYDSTHTAGTEVGSINTLELEVRMDMEYSYSTSLTFDQNSTEWQNAVKFYTNHKDTSRILIRPQIVVASGFLDPWDVNTYDLDAWFASYRSILTTILQEMPEAWGIYVGSSLTSIEGAGVRWLELMEYIRTIFRGQVSYLTRAWSKDDALDKQNLVLWRGVDFIGVDVEGFDITYDAMEDYADPELSDLLNTPGDSQNIIEEIAVISAAWNVPVLVDVPGAGYESMSAGYGALLRLREGYMGFVVGSGGAVDTELLGYSPTATSGYMYGYESPLSLTYAKLSKTISQGGSSLNGWYINKDHRMKGRLTGVPLVAGSDGYVKMVHVQDEDIDTDPAFAFDGAGVFNRHGADQDMTVEFWLRIHGSSDNERKIFGPQETTDGLYVKGNSMSLVVGEYIASANVGILDTPMLINIVWQSGNVRMYINGEAVIDLAHENVVLAHPLNRYMCFWVYEDLGPIDVDNISVYSYLIPQEMMKRRFVMGQGLPQFSATNDVFGGVTARPSFAASKNVALVSYPNNYNWSAGHYFNLSASNGKLEIPERPLPEVSLSYEDEDLVGLYASNSAANIDDDRLFFSFAPEYPTDPGPGYLEFERLADYCQETRAIAVKWETESVSGEETLILMRSKTNTDISFRVYKDDADIKTEFVGPSGTTLLDTTAIAVDTEYVTVVDLSKRFYGATEIPSQLRNFFCSLADIEVQVGGDTLDANATQFYGKIYRVSFFSPMLKAQLDAELTGYPTETINHDLLTLPQKNAFSKGDYSVRAVRRYSEYQLDVEQVGVWEDYVPLVTLAGYVNDQFSERKMSCDLIQYNIGFPTPSPAEIEYAQTYDEWEAGLQALYATYADWEDAIGILTYDELIALASVYYTDEYEVRSFMSFNRVQEKIPSLYSLTGETKAVNSYSLSFDDDGIEYGDKIELVNGMTIVPPRSKRVEDVIVCIYLEITSSNASTRPTSVRTMELSSYFFNKDDFTNIGSESGKPVYVLSDNGNYYNFYTENPFTMSKRNLAPLYLTDGSGVGLQGDISQTIERTVSIPVDDGLTDSSFELALVQFLVFVDDEKLAFEQGRRIFEFDDGTYRVSLTVMETMLGGEYIRCMMVDQDGEPWVNGEVFVNGLQTSSIILHRNEWTSIAVYWDEYRDPVQASPYIRFYHGARFENMSYFPSKGALPRVSTPRNRLDWTGAGHEINEYYSPEDEWVAVMYPGQTFSKDNLARKLFSGYTNVASQDLTPSADYAEVETTPISKGVAFSQGAIFFYSDAATVEYTQKPE